jgi:large subunit ribosomal protein L10
MARSDKIAAVDEIADAFRLSSGAVLTEYRGLSVQQLKELRRALGEHATYAVVKNTLTKLAADKAGVEGVNHHLVGPTAIAFVKGDVVETAKSLRDFARANAALVIKGGFLDGRPVDTEEISKLADLESREILLAKLAGGMKASLRQAVSLVSAPLSQTARLVAAYHDKRNESGEVPAADGTAEVAADVAVASTPAPQAAESADAPTAAAPVTTPTDAG